MSLSISVIIPTLNEEQRLAACLESLPALAPAEVIVVDGGSLDRTVEIARAHAARVEDSPRGRARQLNSGAKVAGGELLLFLHADCQLPPHARDAIETAFADPGVGYAAFRHRIESPRWSLRVISAADNLRAGWLRRPFGDQGLVVRRSLFERAGGYPDVPILEDLLLVKQLRRMSRFRLLDATLLTDARRWERRGVLKTTAINWCVLAGAAIGVPLNRLARLYYGRRPA